MAYCRQPKGDRKYLLKSWSMVLQCFFTIAGIDGSLWSRWITNTGFSDNFSLDNLLILLISLSYNNITMTSHSQNVTTYFSIFICHSSLVAFDMSLFTCCSGLVALYLSLSTCTLDLSLLICPSWLVTLDKSFSPSRSKYINLDLLFLTFPLLTSHISIRDLFR